MKNFKLVKTTAALALGASVVTAAVVPGATTASAASKYKVSNGKLVNAKTGKVVKGYVVFKSKLYYNGKLKKGYKTVGSGKTIKLYYNGKLKEGYKTARNNKLLFFNGSLKKGYKTAGNGERLYKDGHLDKGYEVYGDVDKDPSLYYNGYLKSGYKTANNATLLFYNGKLKSGYKTAKEGTVLYKEGRLNEGLALVGGKLFKDSSLNKGLVKYEDKFYFDADLANGTYEYEGKEIAIEKGVEVGAKVNSVEAINGTTVKVTFNKAVDKTDAEKANVVTISDVELSAGKLSEDGKTLTLTSTKAIKVTDATVVVNAIKTKADDKVSTEKYVGKMTYEDKVAPSIVSVEAKTNGTVAKTATVELSEPVKSTVLVKVDGDYAAVTAFTGTSDTLELTGLNLEAGKTHTVEVINAEDAAGNKVVSTTATFTVSVDAVTPVATVSAGANDKEILVTFNKPMNVSKVAGITVKDEALASVNIGAITPVANTNDTQFTIAVSDAIFANKDSRTFSVVLPKDMEDKLGNKTADSVQKVTLTKDAAKPVATGYNVLKDKDGKVEAIEINFSEGLSAGSVTTGSSLHDAASSIVDANGVLDQTTFENFKSQAVKAGDKKVVFKTATPVAISGQYAISFKTDLVTDLSEAGNKSAAFNYTIDFGQGQQATEFELESTKLPSATNNVITVTFKEAVKGGAVAGSATDVANYTLGGKPLPTGTTITLDKDQKVATIKLPAESIAKDDKAAVFTVANVKNTAGTKTLKSYAGTVDVKDNVAPKLQSAQLLADGKTFVLTYDENLKSTSDIEGAFKFTEDAKDVTANLTVKSVTGKTIIVEAQKAVTTPAVKAPATGFYDETGKAYAVKAGDKIGTDYTYFNAGDVIVPESAPEANDAKTATTAGFYDATGTAYTVKSGDAIGANKYYAKDAVIVAAVTNNVNFDLTKAVTIETVAAADKVEDAAGNDQKAEIKVTTTR
ncbi:hypothetical protein [Rummeliibacillus stabekisii]|uniref:hypothetical protein n=1 Tax=Rummeliibacillus stabekisii TaxID=241244 RepID=UPI00116DFACA|nr:hypothetical protein [Rummeliibacillus stabekisii]MBB5170421.1 hypothetical protein [Rummeliibacillus stabekisii]GEL04678.1 hypothetical protein RST01_13050 [Rummeliibacillus stabekisii]